MTPEQDSLIRQAAGLEHSTVTGFVLDTVTAKAATVVEQRRNLTVSDEAFDKFMAALDGPANEVPQLTKPFRQHPTLPDA